MMKLSKFNDVDNRTLRAWNRYAVFFNTLGNVGVPQALDYMRQFPRADKDDLLVMLRDIKKMGYEGLKAAVSRGDYVIG
jgi:hypothetical protein